MAKTKLKKLSKSVGRTKNAPLPIKESILSKTKKSICQIKHFIFPKKKVITEEKKRQNPKKEKISRQKKIKNGRWPDTNDTKIHKYYKTDRKNQNLHQNSAAFFGNQDLAQNFKNSNNYSTNVYNGILEKKNKLYLPRRKHILILCNQTITNCVSTKHQ